MPRWTHEQYEAFIARNYPPCPKPQPIVCNGAVGKAQREKENSGRILVVIESFARKLTDPDNLCPKYFVDCLRYAEIIPDDRPQDIDLRVSQTKVKTKQEEKTLIHITKP